MNKSIIISEPRSVSVVDASMPVPKDGEVLLKMRYGGICGSDLGTYRGSFAYVSYPRIPGHEFSAEIVQVGPNDRGLKPGMVVTANPYFNCGKCYSCRRGIVNACVTNQTLGAQRDGAFSTYIVLPIERIYDGKGLSPKALALVEPYCISYHGVSRADIRKGERVLIIGAGTIGIMAMLAAKQFGARVYVADVAEGKLEYARSFGADGTLLNTSPEAFAALVSETTEGDGFDVVVEAVGLPSTFQAGIDACAYGARFVQIGVGKQNLDFNFTLIQKKELHVLGSRNALKQDFLDAIDYFKSGAFDFERVISATFPFDDAAKAFETFDKNAGSMLKVMIEF